MTSSRQPPNQTSLAFQNEQRETVSHLRLLERLDALERQVAQMVDRLDALEGASVRFPGESAR